MNDDVDNGASKPLATQHEADLATAVEVPGPQVEASGALSPLHNAEKCRLLLLPRELRDIIYQYTLVEDGDVLIAANGPLPAEPGLLSTCTQVRMEASIIYYETNKFNFTVVNDHNASSFLRWSRSSKQRRSANIGYTLGVGMTNWPNLRQWLKAFWDEQCGGVSLQGGNFDNTAAPHFFALIPKFRALKLTWVQVEWVYEDMRNALGSHDKAWLVEATD